MSYYQERKKLLDDKLMLATRNNNPVQVNQLRARIDELMRFHEQAGAAIETTTSDLKAEQLNELTVKELKDVAKAIGAEGYSTCTKQELIELLLEHDG